MSTASNVTSTEKSPIPAWAWVFAIACGAIPVITLGGAIPGALGFGGAAGCVSVARDPDKPVGTRVAICAVITGACWLVFFGVIAGLS